MTFKNMVFNILVNHPDSRSSDKIILFYLMTDYGVDPRTLDTEMNCKLDGKFLFNNTAFPNIETVTRTRRKVMEEHPELKPLPENNLRNNDVFYKNIPCFINHVFTTDLYTQEDINKALILMNEYNNL